MEDGNGDSHWKEKGNSKVTATARNPRLSGAGPTHLHDGEWRVNAETLLVRKGGGAKHCQFWTGRGPMNLALQRLESNKKLGLRGLYSLSRPARRPFFWKRRKSDGDIHEIVRAK